MSSQLNVDTIVDKAGSGGTNVKVGNTSTYVSDGGATTQNTVQGLAKAWGTVVAQATVDSFNNSSDTDVGAGQFEHNFTNNFTAANYVSSASCGAAGGVRTFIATNWYESGHYTTALSRTGTYDEANSAYEDTSFSVARFGDLA
jgi:hypothetical protein